MPPNMRNNQPAKTATFRTIAGDVGSAIFFVVFVAFVAWAVLSIIVVCSGAIVDVWEENKPYRAKLRAERNAKLYSEYKFGDKAPPGWRKGEWELYKAEHPEKVDDYLWGQVLDMVKPKPIVLPPRNLENDYPRFRRQVYGED